VKYTLALEFLSALRIAAQLAILMYDTPVASLSLRLAKTQLLVSTVKLPLW
jgi:hypothetical protein